ncbi:MAG: hypothetical protein ACRDJH_22835 [Thermomicrobiales bacterium]
MVNARWLGLAMLLLSGGISNPAGVTAEETTPTTSGEILDLPAMTLYPHDLDEDGYGVLVALFTDRQSEAESMSKALSIDPNDLESGLAALGWLMRYDLYLALPRQDDPLSFATVVVSYVTQYADADSAADGFAMLEDESGDAAAEDVEGSRTFGDESELTRATRSNPSSGEQYEALDLTFRIDNLVAGVAMHDYTGSEPAVEEVEALGDVLLGKAEAALAGTDPGLSGKVLRLTEADGFTFEYVGESYLQTDGQALTRFAEDERVAQRRAEFWAAQGVIDVYQNEQHLLPPGVTNSAEELAFFSSILTFDTERHAADFVDAAANQLVEHPEIYTNVDVVDDVGSVGHATRAVSFDLLLHGYVPASGFQLWAQSGTSVVAVSAGVAGGVELKTIEELATAQVACLERDVPCEPVPMPDNLIDEQTSEI